MLLEMFELDQDVRSLQVIFGLIIGLIFGAAAQITRFCLRRAIAGESSERGPAAAVWVTAFASAIAGFAIANAFGLVNLEGHRYLDPDISYLAIILGGLAFGAGMVLTRGCVSRLTVLSGTGNMRALVVLIVFAIAAHATLKGILAPVRTSLGSVSAELPIGSFMGIPAGAIICAALAIAGAVYLGRRFRPGLRDTLLGVAIGLTAVLGWATTSVLLFDEFDPLVVQSAAFTLPWSDTLFWIIASSAIPAGFGTGLIGGVLGGSFLSAAARGELQLQSLENPMQCLRYVAGATLMGVGGVLAGGCTVGAGLSGSATLSIAALLALVSIASGAALLDRFVINKPSVVTA